MSAIQSATTGFCPDWYLPRGYQTFYKLSSLRIMSQASPFTKDVALERFLKNLPEDVANSFTLEQLKAMQVALQSTQWRRHPIDIRLSIPLLWKRFYFVLVAGPERRSKQRLKSDQIRNPVWTPVNLLFATGLIGLGILAALGLFQLKSISLDTLTGIETHPAGIPFKEDQAACEESGRTWEEGKCIDYHHDPIF
ncbi:MAG: hypothetical protein F6K42_01845 [Leptolyngbya sp. SIO1D8]|nr:hypothetical protein [Leptolyngbya sp. SIO1D8]